MNTLLEGPSRMAFYTDLRPVFEAFAGRQQEFNWLLSDLRCMGFAAWTDPEYPIWLSGEALTHIVSTHNIQVVWGVFSGFPSHALLDCQHMGVEPYADGNGALWQSGVTIQHPQALVELVCWDSSALLLLSKDDDITHRFRTFFPEAVDLDCYNQQRAGIE